MRARARACVCVSHTSMHTGARIRACECTKILSTAVPVINSTTSTYEIKIMFMINYTHYRLSNECVRSINSDRKLFAELL